MGLAHRQRAPGIPPYLVAADDTETTYRNTAKQVDILNNDDGSCDQPVVLAHDAASAQGGMVILLTDAGPLQRDTLRYIPPTGFVGTDTFNYFATNSFGDIDSAQVTVTVEEQPSITSEYLVYDQSDRSIRRIDATSHELLGYFLPAFNNDLVRPRSIAVLPDGDVLVGDDALDQVLRFNGSTGALEGVFYEHPDLLSCEAIHVYDGRVYMLDYFGGWIFSCDLNGNDGVNIFQGTGFGRDMTISPDGEIFMSGSVDGNAITAVDRTSGAVLHTIASLADIELAGGLTFANGSLQVGDGNTGEIVRIDPWGTGNTTQWTVDSTEASVQSMSGVLEFAEGPHLSPLYSFLAALSPTACLEIKEDANTFASMGRSAHQEKFDFPYAITYREPVLTVPADLNLDLLVNGADLGLLLGAYGSPGPVGDINEDGIVDGADMGLLLAAWNG